MGRLLRESLRDGAFCLSSGLIYPPGCYADAEELTALCRELLPYGAFYETHMRDEGEGVVEALQEALTVSRQSGRPPSGGAPQGHPQERLAGPLQNHHRPHRPGSAAGHGR